MPTLRSEILGILDRVRGEVRDADIVMANRLVTRYAELASLRVAGEDVDSDLAIVLASLDNVRAGVYGSLASEIRSVVMDWTAKVMSGLIRGGMA